MTYPDANFVVRRLGQPDVRVRGKQLARVASAANAIPEGDLWSELVLLESPKGSWTIVVKRPARNMTGLVGEIYHISNPLEVAENMKEIGLVNPRPLPSSDEAKEQMVNQLMTKLQWSVLAKRLADQMQWDVVVNA